MRVFLSLNTIRLVQGTACIYSRKVEHYYNLVFQTLEYLAGQKQKLKVPTDHNNPTSIES
jgi:hypothetical protein